jgi:hypothetical protein
MLFGAATPQIGGIFLSNKHDAKQMLPAAAPLRNARELLFNQFLKICF